MQLPLPGKVTLLVKGCDVGKVQLKVGAQVLTGQRLQLTDDPRGFVMSTVTGTVTDISAYAGYLNEAYVSISIDVSGEDQVDEATVSVFGEPSYGVACDYLADLPGKRDFSSLLRLDPPVNTVVVNCMDQDLLVSTCGYVVLSDLEGLVAGIEVLKQVAKVGRVMVVAPQELVSGLEGAGIEVMAVSSVYPSGLPGMIAKDVLGGGYMPGKSFEQMGLGFISAEAVVSLGALFSRSELPIDKVVTVIGKDESVRLVKVRIGTPVGDVFKAAGISTAHGDRVVMGGPMAGVTIYTEEMPILADTDALMVQDQSEVVLAEDVQCVNCGECVRVCPVKVPVNMLVRVLSSGLYEDAAQMYDLHCCIECGLCDYVCVARIPIFHHIMLGKHECARLEDAEGSNG
jgi:electron transport complex protein RnfC